MNYISRRILNLAKQLYPNGRAFWMPPTIVDGDDYVTEDLDDTYATEDEEDDYVSSDSATAGGEFERFNISFGGDGSNRVGTLERVNNDATGILYSMLADNPYFTDGTVNPLDNDCNDWERRLGLVQYGITSATTPTRLQRMAAINTKYIYPGTTAPRQSAEYLQSQLQSAGFNVFVYENLSNQSPDDVIGIASQAANLGGFNLGESNLGEIFGGTVIANYIDEVKDARYAFKPPNFHNTFFISGNPITTFADVALVQKTQFRQLILDLKPAHMAGFLFVNYI